MGSFGTVPLRTVKKLLQECAEGSELKRKKHRYWVLYNGKTYRGLPLGQHGKKTEIEIGHLRSMVRFLGIDTDCAAKFI